MTREPARRRTHCVARAPRHLKGSSDGDGRRLIPPALLKLYIYGYVKPYVKRQKNDASWTQRRGHLLRRLTRARHAVCANQDPRAAERSPGPCTARAMRWFIRQQTSGDQWSNPGPSCRVRDRCAGRRRHGVERTGSSVVAVSSQRHGEFRRSRSKHVSRHSAREKLHRIKEQMTGVRPARDQGLAPIQREMQRSRRLDRRQRADVGPVLAAALVATVAVDTRASFRSGRMTSRTLDQYWAETATSSGVQEAGLGNRSKQGDRYLTRPVLWPARYSRHALRRESRWHQTSADGITALLARRPTKVAAISDFANKIDANAYGP